MNNQSDPPLIDLCDSPAPSPAPSPVKPPVSIENTEISTPIPVKRGRGRPPLSAKRQTAQSTSSNPKKPENSNASDDEVVCLGYHQKPPVESTPSATTEVEDPLSDSSDIIIVPHVPGSSQNNVPPSERRRMRREANAELIEVPDSPETNRVVIKKDDPISTPLSDPSIEKSRKRASRTASIPSNPETPLSKRRRRRVSNLATPTAPTNKMTPAQSAKRITRMRRTLEPVKKDEKLEEAWQGYVPMMNIFSDAGTVADKAKVGEAVKEFTELYTEIREEYDRVVQSEVDNEFSEWLNADLTAAPALPPANFRFKPAKAAIAEHETLKVNSSVVTVPVIFMESQSEKELKPRMKYYVPIEMSIKTEDKPRLTHMPCFNHSQNDRKIFEEFYVHYPEGIHGYSRNVGTINDYLMYRVMRKTLETRLTTVENPDIIYYSLYRMFPNKFSQRDLSQKFASLCRKFAEKNFDSNALEPWKKKSPSKVENLQKIECYACLQHMCPSHGFDKRVPILYPEGHYYKVLLPLHDPSDIGYCSENCWKHIETNKLKPTGLSKRVAEVYISKLKVNLMPIEQGSFLVTHYAEAPNAERKFCEFVAEYAHLDLTDGKVTTCQQIYQLLLDLVEQPSGPKLELLQKSKKHASDFKTRNLAFRRYQENREKQRIRKKYVEKIEEAERLGLDTKALRGECANEIKNMSTMLKATVPFVPCAHEGPCTEDAENCSCRENGICSYLCECDVNCVQRFPGCVCAPGQCGTKLCNCHLASWECSPATCPSCGCDDVDSPETGCKNYSLTRMAHKRTKVALSTIAGFGLFIAEPCAKGELIIEYVGEHISDEEVERRGCIDDRHKASYIFTIQTGGAIDANNAGNNSRFANNNSANPNMDARTMWVAGETRIGMYARKDLVAGEELTFDYRYSSEHLGIFNDSEGEGAKGARRKKTA